MSCSAADDHDPSMTARLPSLSVHPNAINEQRGTADQRKQALIGDRSCPVSVVPRFEVAEYVCGLSTSSVSIPASFSALRTNHPQLRPARTWGRGRRLIFDEF
jgi:hypothetical protein